ncbi:PAS domain-containing protein [Streptomyces sp. NPDC087850]|uniref:response regulator n=1 Tax=Streptomyces sp. NPDC087850 TaxID=3365809 RepID=UPI0037F8509A
MSSRPSRGAARLAAILDALPDGLVLVNANGTVVNANTIALEMFETPGTALVGRGLLDLLPDFDSKLIPGSMRRPASADPLGRTKPTRMIARRTDGGEFPAEVTSASLEDGRDAYNDSHSYTGDELLMLVVRDLSGTMDTEAELARSQRQTEMILRAASEGVVGTDTDGRVVLVNPAAAQILGFRASDLGGRELHTLVMHSRADGETFQYSDSPLADTLRSGRKHRVRGQVLWAKSGEQVPVDLTTSPVRDGDQLVGAVMTFTDRRPYDELADQHATELAETEERHAAELAGTTKRLTAELTETTERLTAELTETTERLGAELAEAEERHAAELADRSDRYAAEIEELTERYDGLAGRHSQLTAVLGDSLRGPLLELRDELTTLAADPAGQLWPEANQILHHLSAGYSRMTTLVDNVLGYQRLDIGAERLTKTTVLLDGVVAAGVEGAIELIGPGRAQFAVHAPPIEAEVDAARLATALAHLVADVAGVDSTGRARQLPAGGYVDSTIVVAAAQRGDVVRIEVRGPFSGGDAVHEPIVRGIVRAHGGVLQTHEVPGMSGSAYVLELPLGEGSGTVPSPHRVPVAGQPQLGPGPSAGPGPGTTSGGRRRARRASTDAFLEGPEDVPAGVPAGAPAGMRAATAEEVRDTPGPTGRRRARSAADADAPLDQVPPEDDSLGLSGVGSGGWDSAVTLGGGSALVGAPTPGAGTSTGGGSAPGSGGTGRRRGRPSPAEDATAESGAVPVPAPSEGSVVTAAEGAHPTGRAALGQAVPPQGVPVDPSAAGTGRRARRAEQRALPALAAGPSVAGPSVAGPSVAGPSAAGSPTVGPTAGPSVAGPSAAGPSAGPSAAGPAAGSGTAPPSPSVPMPTPVPMPEPGADAEAAPAAAPEPAPASAPVPAPAPTSVAPSPLPDPAPVATVSVPAQAVGQPGGRRARRALAPAQERHVPVPPEPENARSPFALPPAGADRAAESVPTSGPTPDASLPVRHDLVRTEPDADHTPPQPHPLPQPSPQPQGRRAGTLAGQPGQSGPFVDDTNSWGSPPPAGTPTTAAGFGMMSGPPGWPDDPAPEPVQTPAPVPAPAAQPVPEPVPVPVPAAVSAASVATSESSVESSVPNSRRGAHQPLPPAQPLPEEAPVAPGAPAPAPAPPAEPAPLPEPTAEPVPVPPDSTQARGFSVRTLGQGVPFTQYLPQGTAPAKTPAAAGAQPQSLGSGRRRKLGTPPDGTQRPEPQAKAPAMPTQGGGLRLPAAPPEGRSYAIGAPDEGAEGPEPLDGPGGAVEVANRPQPRPVDDELPPEPLDNPRRLLVWPAPDSATEQALSDRGYRPVVVHSREEVAAQIAAFPAALFVDPLTGPITRTALQSLREAAVAAELPVLVTAGLGQAAREEAYGADPAVLLKALAPRDSEQHPPRVLLIEEHEEIALALTETLERRAMQVARAATDNEAVGLAAQLRPNLVVMDLMQVRRRRAGIIDWLRSNGQLSRTPLVIYTSAGIGEEDRPRLASGETVLFLAERSTTPEVQERIVDLLSKIGTN